MTKCWAATSLQRIHPTTPPESRLDLALEIARGERAAFQVAFRTGPDARELRLTCAAPDGLTVTVRRVGFVPLRHLNIETAESELDGTAHLPGMVPDPLFPEPVAHVGPYESGAFWVTVRADPDLPPGEHRLTPRLESPDGDRTELRVDIRVRPTRLPRRKGFPISHYFHADALSDHYGVEPFSEVYWRIMRPYLADYADHGMDAMLVPHLTPPVDGVKRPIQLLGVRREGDGYAFDWTQVVRWIRLAREYDITTFEWAHLFTQAGAAHAAKVYTGHGETEEPLWRGDVPATDPAYRAFLQQLMPELHRVLLAEGILDGSYIHVSDEPLLEHLDAYRTARDIVRAAAPWATLVDSLSNLEFVTEGLVDVAVPLLNAAPEFAGKGAGVWTYYCCVPRGAYVNRFLDTPLTKVRMTGWLLHANRAGGFVHWAYNYWYRAATRELIDPFQITDAGNWPQWGPGDAFVVYPGPDGPIDSIRWEVFADSLQDLTLLRAVGEAGDSGKPSDLPDDRGPDLTAIEDYATFPRDSAWIDAQRSAAFDVLDVQEL